MNPLPPRAELRPADTPVDDRFTVPLLRLRRRDREPIPPEACLVGERCLVCRWRREGLLDRADAGPQTSANQRSGPAQAVEKRGVRGLLRLLPGPQKAAVGDR